jgi:Family of unknown function (DUF6520)
MKKSKFFMASAFVFALASAFAFKPSSTAHGTLDVTRYKNITNCPSVSCGSSGSASCNGFYQNANCTSPVNDGKLYTP